VVRVVRATLLAAAALLAAFTVARTVAGLALPSTGVDIYYFWYHSYYIFVRHGPEPFPPVDRADRIVFARPPVPTATTPLAELPSPPASPYPPAILLLFSPLAHLSFPLAKAVWAGIDVVLALVIGGQTADLFRPVGADRRWTTALLACTCLGLLPTRNVITNGQTSLLILAAMLLAVRLSREHAGWAGGAFGVALCKYSLAAPVGLWLLYRRRWLSLAVAVALQAAALGVVAFVANTSPVHMLRVMAATRNTVGQMPGIHFAMWVGHAPAPTLALVACYSLIVGGGVANWLRRARSAVCLTQPLMPADGHLFVIAGLWSLLVVYHREYDAVLYILFVGLIAAGLQTDWWRLSQGARWTLAAWTIMGTLWLSRPGLTVAAWLPEPWASRYATYAELGTTAVVLVSSLVALGLLYRLRDAVTLQPASRAAW
jgi:hypothetical protein